MDSQRVEVGYWYCWRESSVVLKCTAPDGRDNIRVKVDYQLVHQLQMAFSLVGCCNWVRPTQVTFTYVKHRWREGGREGERQREREQGRSAPSVPSCRVYFAQVCAWDLTHCAGSGTREKPWHDPITPQRLKMLRFIGWTSICANIYLDDDPQPISIWDERKHQSILICFNTSDLRWLKVSTVIYNRILTRVASIPSG